ncbi:hypothetical protein [[Mycobacterium] wendilense]|uniref:Uncharacterized protein n=1 Tax=[Mycobacterium] wendilense TaxID=3064284 RepID=A0ABN9P8Q5_9MYCO|nr:hypothetical protein [Mycolicibacterium sp. MU0050]CAJ1587040.1 hypothetical protein MU0050_004582 [Mycolicibacterium sp. MU0050]
MSQHVILACNDPATTERYAAEVAPAVRELVTSAREDEQTR